MHADMILNRINAAAPCHAGKGYDDEDWKDRIKALRLEMLHLALDVTRLNHAERQRLTSLITHRLLPGGPTNAAQTE